MFPCSDPTPFLAHVRRCHNVVLPGDYHPLYCADQAIGWVAPRYHGALVELGVHSTADGLLLPDGHDLLPLGERMAEAGLYRPHDELFDVFTSDGRALGTIDRGALPLLGLAARGVHMNGLVRRPDGLHLWMGHRAPNKRLDPGKLDHLVAGGVCAGITPREALAKEAAEEANISGTLIARAEHAGDLHYAMIRPEGLRRDVLHCFDLHLPEDFAPRPMDGEVSAFELVPIETAFRRVRDTQDVKFNVNLVLIDLFIRLGLFTPEAAATLRDALSTA
ncbi:thiamin pyrophosphokinase [Neoasaia chiangmaiensis NBRC 101099]|nr:NUDIX domain-containing protein [Neoasaia chiangmaiensis]GBR38545.1 thiamin pyrophosphokinase [Neoasaia chiangmaiensis NBRC 101099]GEN15849.1 DUF4743 domain-containing protein [Neoasaia chiangmaiensis]